MGGDLMSAEFDSEFEKARKNPNASPAVRAAARKLGRTGASAGGKKRAQVLSPARRHAIALEGGRARMRQRRSQTT